MLNTAVVFNGPPNVGKDTLARLMVPLGFAHREFKSQLYRDTIAFFRVPEDDFMARATDRDRKDVAWPPLSLWIDGRPRMMSPREALIHVSENVLKPQYGKDYFGKAMAERCKEEQLDYVAFSDGGFPAEIHTLRQVYKHVFIFMLQRKGCVWGNDSRDYLRGMAGSFWVELTDDQPELAIAQVMDILPATALPQGLAA